MENQIYIPDQVLSNISAENAAVIRNHVAILNKNIPEIYSQKVILPPKVENMIYMFLILEKLLFSIPDAIGELAKIQILRKDLLEKEKDNLKASGYRSMLLYPWTLPVKNTNIGNIAEATLFATKDPLEFKPISELPPEAKSGEVLVYTMFTNSDFYFYAANKGFVGESIAPKAVTEELVERCNYISKVAFEELNVAKIGEESLILDFPEVVTSEKTFSRVNPTGVNSGAPIYFILNDKFFAKITSNVDELEESRISLFKILPKEMEFPSAKAAPKFKDDFLFGDVFAKQRLKELFERVAFHKNTEADVKIRIINTLTEIFFHKLEKTKDLEPLRLKKLRNKSFFFKKQHVYMIFYERLLSVISNIKGSTNKSTIQVFVDMVANDDTGKYGFIIAELKN